MIDTPLAQSLHRLGTETAFEVLARREGARGGGATRSSTSRSASPTSTPHRTSSRRPSQALRDGHTHYCPAPGIPELREAIAALRSRARAAIDVAAGQVVVTPGAKPIMFFTILALVRARRRGHLPEPRLPDLRVGDQLRRGATPVPLPLPRSAASAFDVAGRSPSRLTDRTRLIILNSPAEPDRRRRPGSDRGRARRGRSREHPCWILSDEVYSRDGLRGRARHRSRACPGMLERTILLDGFSKTYAMTGWRLGYGVVPEPSSSSRSRACSPTADSCTRAVHRSSPASRRSPARRTRSRR